MTGMTHERRKSEKVKGQIFFPILISPTTAQSNSKSAFYMLEFFKSFSFIMLDMSNVSKAKECQQS